MIINFILDIIYNFIWWLTLPIRSLSDVVLPVDISGSLATAGQYLSMISVVLPISSFIAVLSFILIVETAILTFKAINWIIRKIPTIS